MSEVRGLTDLHIEVARLFFTLEASRGYLVAGAPPSSPQSSSTE